MLDNLFRMAYIIIKFKNKEGFDMEHIISDRYGYWEGIDAASADEAVRMSSNLAPEANLDYAITKYVGEATEISDEEIARQNCARAMDIGGYQCQCGHHE